MPTRWTMPQRMLPHASLNCVILIRPAKGLRDHNDTPPSRSGARRWLRVEPDHPPPRFRPTAHLCKHLVEDRFEFLLFELQFSRFALDEDVTAIARTSHLPVGEHSGRGLPGLTYVASAGGCNRQEGRCGGHPVQGIGRLHKGSHYGAGRCVANAGAILRGQGTVARQSPLRASPCPHPGSHRSYGNDPPRGRHRGLGRGRCRSN
jgi:hypothetical protein